MPTFQPPSGPAKVTRPEDGHCNETETSASNSVHSVHIQTRSSPEDCDSDIKIKMVLNSLTNSTVMNIAITRYECAGCILWVNE